MLMKIGSRQKSLTQKENPYNIHVDERVIQKVSHTKSVVVCIDENLESWKQHIKEISKKSIFGH